MQAVRLALISRGLEPPIAAGALLAPMPLVQAQAAQAACLAHISRAPVPPLAFFVALAALVRLLEPLPLTIAARAPLVPIPRAWAEPQAV